MLASAPPPNESLRICPLSAGGSATPGLSLFLPEISSLPSRYLESVVCCFLQYLQVPYAGVPVQAAPRSVGRLAKAPQ
eukprot:3293876-Heterocapsa_arctica.AAC.1